MTGVESLASIIRRVMSFTLYFGRYAAVVQGQHEDDTLDLLPDDERIRGNGLVRVPIRHGLPGVRVRVVVGSRVRVGFENGDPSKPFASMWDPGAIETISFDGGTRPVARRGDTVAIYWPPQLLTIVGTIGAGAGVPFTATFTIATPSAGVIETGKENVLA